MMFASGADIDILPAIPVHALSPIHSDAPFPPMANDVNGDVSSLPRSASYTHLPGVIDAAAAPGLKRTFSENVLPLVQDVPSISRGAPYFANRDILRRASKGRKARISVSKFTLTSDDLVMGGPASNTQQQNFANGESPRASSRSVAGTIRSLARRSWISSRSPSPSPRESKKTEKSSRRQTNWNSTATNTPEPIAAPAAAVSTTSPRQSRFENPEPPPLVEPTPTPRQQTRRPQQRQRPLSSILVKNKSETELQLSRSPSLRSLRSRVSLDHLQSAGSTRLLATKIPPLPTSLSSDKLFVMSVDMGKRKDALWGAFRALEGDFQKWVLRSNSSWTIAHLLPDSSPSPARSKQT